MRSIFALLGITLFAAIGTAHEHHEGEHTCGHELEMAEIRERMRAEGREDEDIVPRGMLNKDVHPQHPRGARALAEQQWRPLRIVPEYLDMSGLTASQQTYLKDEIIAPMVTYAGQLLKVRQRTNDDRMWVGRECGSLTMVGDDFVCHRTLKSTAGMCMGETIPDKYYGTISTWDFVNSEWEETVHAGGEGAPGDFILLVTAKASGACGLGALGHAASCMRDDIDRPIAGRYNHCPDAFDDSIETKYETQITALHEIFHALGFAIDNFQYFRDPETLNPLFPPEVDGYSSREKIKPTGCGSALKFPASMIEWSGERGQPSCPDIETAASIGADKCTHRMVLPKVKEESRKWFACNEINGAELENQDKNCQLASSHWEMRTMQADLMVRRLGKNSRVTPMTLALFEDSGWFKADYSQISFTPGREWGHLAGCDIFNKKGIYPADPASPYSDLQIVRTAAPLRNNDPFFCLARGGTNYCTMDLRAAGQCQVNEFNFRDIEDPYRYFTSAKKSGTFAENDQLPHVGPNFQCAYESSRTSQDQMWTAIGSYFGNAHPSACFATSLRHAGQGRSSASGCYRHTCDMTNPDSPVLTIQPLNMAKDGVQGDVVCNKGDGGQQKSVTGMTGTITCVEPEVLCGSNAAPAPIPSASPSPIGKSVPSSSPDAAASPSSSPDQGNDGGSGSKGDNGGGNPAPSSSPTSPDAAASPSSSPDQGNEGEGGSSASPSPTTSPSALPAGASVSPSPSMAPIAVNTQELVNDYCPGTTDAHTSGDYPSVAGAVVNLDGVEGAITCNAAPDLQAACARVLGVDEEQVAVKVPGGARRRRLQGGSSQEITVAVAAESAEAATQLATALETSVTSGSLVTELAVENQAAFGGATASVPATGGTFSGSLPPVEEPVPEQDQVNPAIAYGALAGMVVLAVAVVGTWLYMRKGPSSGRGNTVGKDSNDKAADVTTDTSAKAQAV